MLRKLYFFIFLIVVSFISNQAYADFNLSVMPVNGGGTLRLGRVTGDRQINKEVRIRVSSTDAKEYQVFQRLVEPLRNERNQILHSNAIKTYSIVGSNSNGTLYINSPETLTQVDQLMYSSASNGESDSMTFVYAIDNQWLDSYGQYFGRIAYTVRPFGGAGQQTVFLNITLDAEGDLKVEIEGSTNRDTVRLGYKGRNDKEGFVKISFKGNAGDIRIYQQVDNYIQDKDLQEINRSTILFLTSGSPKGELSQQTASELTAKRILLYSSQENDDVFFVNYLLNSDKILEQKAGQFFGKVTFIVESNGQEVQKQVDMEVEISPVFTMEVDFPLDGMSFSNLLPDSPPIVKEVVVKVSSNLNKPYMVTQNVAAPLTDAKGHQIPEEHFTIKGEMLSGSEGKLVSGDFKPVVIGESPIFTSGPNGESSSFKILYRLRSYSEILAGDYETVIRFSLGEI